ncbi:MAG: MBL fold metallo-hydrolase [Candidatus Thalassarchaeaceae archaeon]|nr:MBL fold metallo-hydrolase [Candidatus Thalassarchaeaceae archaeon]MDP7446797.1 MBL fold metallo-hydrolase [Candidatus Thalassarchaeaceae archaeon]MDP7648660.1 MBL fold metallo-hydrolase [Candidatus Thalassarchaeaceae archaeon]HJO84198.1 MBL fold metallo-hydrolase [Candidatus Thalassarchaeaceae archaeon]|tara:strand:+ start:15076 stop:15954 length:879 start_codon:yes stop_codon:yes gene_type:complete
MGVGSVELVILGVAQDGGVPQAGCSCRRCVAALADPSLRRHPVACGVRGIDGSLHLIEASRALPDHLAIWSAALGLDAGIRPDTVCLTHTHLGHIDGLGQFGIEAMGASGVPLFASSSVIEAIEGRGLASPFECRAVEPGIWFQPSDGCGFEYSLVPVPHRDEESDMHAVAIRGPGTSILFLPDHDDWTQTLDMHGADGIREWFSGLGVGIALLDGTFWDASELPGRDVSQIPHPTISETLGRLGERRQDDPEVRFVHMNHSNPALDETSEEAGRVEALGWSVAEQSSVLRL